MPQPGVRQEVGRLLIVGIVNTLVGFGGIVFGQTVLQLGPYGSNVLGYALGLACSYGLNSRWTFRAGAGSPGRILLFAVAFALAYGVNLAVLHLLLGAGAMWLIAQAIAMLVYTVLFFALCRWVVFRRPPASLDAPGPNKSGRR